MASSLPRESQEPVRLVVKHTFLEFDDGQGAEQEGVVPHERRRKSDSSVQRMSGYSTLLEDEPHRAVPERLEPAHEQDDEEGSALSGIDSRDESRRGSWASQDEFQEGQARYRQSVCSVMTSNGWEDTSAAYGGPRRGSRQMFGISSSQRSNKIGGLYQDDGPDDGGMMPSSSLRTDYGEYGEEEYQDPNWSFYQHARGHGSDAGSRLPPLSTAPTSSYTPSGMPPPFHPAHPPPHPGYGRYPPPGPHGMPPPWHPHYPPPHPHHPPHPGYGHPGYYPGPPPHHYGYPPHLGPPRGYHHPPSYHHYAHPPPPQQFGDPMRPAWLYPPNGPNGSGGGSGSGRARAGDRERGDQGSREGGSKGSGVDASFLQASSAGCRTTYSPTKTTVMLRNIPWGFSRDSLTSLLDKNGFNGLYDFVYMPMNFRSKASFGYAFVNLVSSEAAEKCHDKFNGFEEWGVETDKICEVSWSDMHQGLTAHIDRYRNSPVMHESVPDEYKPVMYSGGVRVAFPAPTKKIRQPRIRRTTEGGEAGDDDDDGEEDEEGAIEEEGGGHSERSSPPAVPPPAPPAALQEQAVAEPPVASTGSAGEAEVE